MPLRRLSYLNAGCKKVKSGHIMSIEIQHDLVNHAFTAKVSGEISQLQYRKIDDQTLDYYRTFVPETLRNHGIASKLTQHALEYALANNYHIIPSCSYVDSYIERHPEYAHLIKKNCRT